VPVAEGHADAPQPPSAGQPGWPIHPLWRPDSLYVRHAIRWRNGAQVTCSTGASGDGRAASGGTARASGYDICHGQLAPNLIGVSAGPRPRWSHDDN
jgi:hypothetical protein